MHKTNRQQKLYFSLCAKIKHDKFKRRELAKHKLFLGWLKFLSDVRAKAQENNQEYEISSFEKQRHNRRLGPKPELSETIKYLTSKKEAFAGEGKPRSENGYFEIPEKFTLTENYAESFWFLKRLYFALYNQSVKRIEFDYAKCKLIDVDASVCMDILPGEFISHYNNCKRKGHDVKILEIIPVNFSQPHILKILFSIGAFASIKGVSIKFPDIIPYRLCIANNKHPNAPAICEVHITQMVEYIIRCMAKMNRTLTDTAEANLFKVIGEVLINAEEHSTCSFRYSAGYFQDTQENGEHIGIFNLVILNFGKTIYEKFSDPDCPNKAVVEQMKELSNSYTKRGLFSKAEFEEQTLWTLYALQEEVTSKADWKRGNGSIRFIDSFFNLKGDNVKDNISCLSIVSGNTRITFDGSYRLIPMVKGKNSRKYSMMAFNDTGEIENKPDKKYVTFAENYFPGTIISAKLCIKEINTLDYRQ